MAEKVEMLIEWAADVAKQSGYNVTTTEVLNALNEMVSEGIELENAKKEIKGVYTNEEVK